MKAVVLHEYGPASNLKYEEFEDPKPNAGEVLVHVSATSINPIDWKMRSGAVKDRFPVEFPGILGRDVAGVVREVGADVKAFAAGDRVMALAEQTYAELCVVPAAALTKIPEGMEMATAASLPLVNLTGDQLIRLGANVQPEQTVLITGALGAVGRSAVFAAAEIGAKVIAGVRAKQVEQAKQLRGVAEVVVLEDEGLARLGFVDCIADTVGGPIASKLLGKVKQGGTFASVTNLPDNAALHPTVAIKRIAAQPNTATTLHYAQAVQDGKLDIPVDRLLPLHDAAEGQAAAEKGGIGKVVLII